MRRYDVLVLAGGDAYDQLRQEYPVVRIPALRYYHNKRGRRSALLTLRRNARAILDMVLEGPVFRMVRDRMKRFDPCVVLSDSEGWTHRAARSLGIGRISFDHYGVMAYCRLEMSAADRLVCWAESLVYRTLVCRPERIIVVAFYKATPRRRNIRIVGPILRKEVRQARPVAGEYLLVYFSNASVNFTPRIEQALLGLDCPVKVYGPNRSGRQGNLRFCPIGNVPFVRDLAGCRAVFSTAGNQIISEAINLNKPLLLMPEESLEQRLNARFVHRWRIGMETRPKQVTTELLRRFLDRMDEFAGNIPAHRRDGLAEATDAIERAIGDLVTNTAGA